jgi:hypothetical protein
MRHTLGRASLKIAFKVHAILQIRRRSLVQYPRMLIVCLHVEALTNASIGTAPASPSRSYTAVPPMFSFAGLGVAIIGNLEHLHSSSDAKFTNATIARDFASIPVFKWPFFRVRRRTRRSAVD